MPRAGITLGTFLAPPVSDGMSGEGGSIVRNADHNSAAIFVDVINAIGNSDADGIGSEIMIIDAARLAFPAAAGISEIAYQFALLAVDADDGKMPALKAATQFRKLFELKIAVGAGTGGNLFVIDAE